MSHICTQCTTRMAILGALRAAVHHALCHIHLCPVLRTMGPAHAGDEREAALSEFYEEWKDEVRLHAVPHLQF